MIAGLLTRFPRLSALIVGTASATGFAPLGLWPVTLIALAVLMHLVSNASTAKRAFLLGWLFALGHFTLSLHWIATAFTYQAAMPPILGWVAVPLVSLYLAIYPALATSVAWWVWRFLTLRHSRPSTALQALRINLSFAQSGSPSPKDAAFDGPEMDSRLRGNDENIRVGAPLPFTLLFAATWIITEWLRSWVFTGFAWNPLAAIAPWAAMPTQLIGTYGQSGIVILMAAAFWLAARRKFSRAAMAALPLTAAAIIGWITLALPGIDDTETTQVTIVQPNIDQGDKWDLAQRFDNFHRLARLSTPRTPATPRLLLWPEAAVPDYLEDSTPPDWTIEDPARVRTRLAALLGPDDLLLTGAVKLEPNADGSDIIGARNAVFTLNAAGRLGPRYDKAHLVPYGEYLPMRSILEPLGLSRLAPGAVDFWAGPGARSIDLGRFGKVGIQICYEIIFSGQVVDRANRPAFIFNPSNDAWFGAWGPPQHLAQARLRAIEEGLPVVRATPTGISAIIDADGRIVESLPTHRAGRIDAALPLPHAPTLFARYGNALPLAFAVFLGMLGVAFGRRRRYSADT